jgi:hypothetical protein
MQLAAREDLAIVLEPHLLVASPMKSDLGAIPLQVILRRIVRLSGVGPRAVGGEQPSSNSGTTEGRSVSKVIDRYQRFAPGYSMRENRAFDIPLLSTVQ